MVSQSYHFDHSDLSDHSHYSWSRSMFTIVNQIITKKIKETHGQLILPLRPVRPVRPLPLLLITIHAHYIQSNNN